MFVVLNFRVHHTKSIHIYELWSNTIIENILRRSNQQDKNKEIIKIEKQ